MQRPSSEAIIIAVVSTIVILPVLVICTLFARDRWFHGRTISDPPLYKEVHAVLANAEGTAVAKGETPVWPVKGQWSSSSDFFRAVLPRRLRKEILDPKRSCCILAGAKDEDDSMPVIWSSNFRVSLDDLLAPVDPTNEVSWAGKLVPGEHFFGTLQVVLVRRGGTFQVIKNKDLTGAAFLGGAVPHHPEALEILEP